MDAIDSAMSVMLVMGCIVLLVVVLDWLAGGGREDD